MGIFSKLKGLLNPILNNLDVSESTGPKLREIGITDPICPYCNMSLNKMPGRKTKCTNCSNFIYVRTRPLDKKKILIREDQFIEFREQQAIADGTYEEFLAERKRYEAIRTKAINEYGREPSENDIQFTLLQEDLISYANSNTWGGYRNARLNMGAILEKEGRIEDAIDTYMEVCYLDLNGPVNCGTKDAALLREFSPFRPELGHEWSSIVPDFIKLLKKQNVTTEGIKLRFIRVAKIQHKNLRLPVAPETAWNKLVTQNPQLF